MRWVCILFPQLALDAVLRQRADPEEPLALLTGPAQRRVLQAVNGPARALGLRPGQSMSAAQALSKGFATAEYDVADIEHWQQFLAAWAYRFSSQVSVHYPRALVFEIESSLGLFGPWPKFERLRGRTRRTEVSSPHRRGAQSGGGADAGQRLRRPGGGRRASLAASPGAHAASTASVWRPAWPRRCRAWACAP